MRVTERAILSCLIGLLTLAASWGVSGCATSSPQVQGAWQYPALSKVPSEGLPERGSSADFSEMTSAKAPSEVSAEALEKSGDIFMNNGDLSMAFVQYEKSLKMKPDNYRIHYKEGLLFLAGNRNKEAVGEFRKVLDREPEHAPTHEGLGQAYFRMKEYSEAKKHLMKSIKLDASLWKAHTFLGVIGDHEKKHDLAAQEYAAAISLRPADGLLYNNLGTSYILAGRYREAVNAFQKALETPYQPKEKIYNNLGLALVELEKYDEALEAFRKAGGEARALNNLGCAYLREGKVEKAIGCFEGAIDASPTFYDTASENARKARMARQIN
jgi:tetratricopeptide (TPR) repeat protein